MKNGSANSRNCDWCGESFHARANGGSTQRFCSPRHRHAYTSNARRYAELLVRRGEVTVPEMKAPSPRRALGANHPAPTRRWVRAQGGDLHRRQVGGQGGTLNMNPAHPGVGWGRLPQRGFGEAICVSESIVCPRAPKRLNFGWRAFLRATGCSHRCCRQQRQI